MFDALHHLSSYFDPPLTQPFALPCRIFTVVAVDFVGRVGRAAVI